MTPLEVMSDPSLLGRGHRECVPYVKFKDYVTYKATMHDIFPVHNLITFSIGLSPRPQLRSKVKHLIPLQNFIFNQFISKRHRGFLAFMNVCAERTRYSQWQIHNFFTWNQIWG